MRPIGPKINFVSIFVSNLIFKKMKKIYFILSCLITVTSFGQVLSDDFNYADNALLTANGWTAFSGTGTASVDVGVSNGLVYTGYSGTTGFTASAVGNAARLDNTGEDVNKNFTIFWKVFTRNNVNPINCCSSKYFFKYYLYLSRFNNISAWNTNTRIGFHCLIVCLILIIVSIFYIFLLFEFCFLLFAFLSFAFCFLFF
jgi:hypothetical protein